MLKIKTIIIFLVLLLIIFLSVTIAMIVEVNNQVSTQDMDFDFRGGGSRNIVKDSVGNLYVAYVNIDSTATTQNNKNHTINISKSTDNGATWTHFYSRDVDGDDNYMGVDLGITSNDLIYINFARKHYNGVLSIRNISVEIINITPTKQCEVSITNQAGSSFTTVYQSTIDINDSLWLVSPDVFGDIYYALINKNCGLVKGFTLVGSKVGESTYNVISQVALEDNLTYIIWGNLADNPWMRIYYSNGSANTTAINLTQVGLRMNPEQAVYDDTAKVIYVLFSNYTLTRPHDIRMVRINTSTRGVIDSSLLSTKINNSGATMVLVSGAIYVAYPKTNNNIEILLFNLTTLSDTVVGTISVSFNPIQIETMFPKSRWSYYPSTNRGTQNYMDITYTNMSVDNNYYMMFTRPQVVLNNIPNFTIIPAIIPTIVYQNGSLNCSFAIEDKDPDQLYANVTWFQNGVANHTFDSYVEVTNQSVNYTSALVTPLTRFDIWMCAVTPYDTVQWGSQLNSTALNVSNTLPIVSSVAISPTTVYQNGSLNCSAIATDLDTSDTLFLNFSWFKDGVLNNTFNSYKATTNGTLSYTNKLVTPVAKEQSWKCTAQAYDSTDYSLWSNSSALVISNTAPNVSQPVINPILASRNNATLNCSNLTGEDPDGDTVIFYYRWYDDDGIVTDSNSSNLSNKTFKHFFNYTCEVTPSDNTINGTARNSTVRYINDSIPYATLVNISPNPAGTSRDLNCTYVYNDLDGDLESGTTFRWYNITQLMSTQQILNKANLTLQSNYTCEVTVNNTYAKGIAVNSTGITIGDDIPPNVTQSWMSAYSVEVNSVVTFYANITEINTISSVKLILTDPNTVQYIFSMANDTAVGTNMVYKYSWTATTPTGTWYAGFNTTDNSGNSINTSLRNLTFIVTSGGGSGSSSSSSGGGSSNSGTSITVSGDQNQSFKFYTADFVTRLDNLIMGANSERTVTLVIENTGTKEGNYTVQCLGEKCQYFVLSDNSFDILPGGKAQFTMQISTPVSLEFGDHIKASLQTSSNFNSEAIIPVDVTISGFGGLLIRLTSWKTYTEQFKLFGIMLPKITAYLIWIIAFALTFVMPKSKLRLYIQTIGGFVLFAFITILISLV